MKDFLLTAFMAFGCILLVCNDMCCDLMKIVNMLVFSISVLMWATFSTPGKELTNNML